MSRANGGVVLFGAWLALLAWAPLPLGSNRDWSAALLAAGALALAATWCLSRAWRPAAAPPAVRDAAPALASLVAWAALSAAQSVALPGDVLDRIAPRVLAAYRDAASADGADAFPLSLDAGASVEAALQLCGYAAILFLAVALVDSRRRLRVALAILFAVGVAESAYALAVHVAGEGAGLWRPPDSARGANGTYVNQNHFAGLLEMSIPAGIALLLEREAGRARRGAAALLGFALGHRTLVSFGLILTMAALLLSSSRGGIVALVAGLAVAAGAAVATRGVSARGVRLVAGVVSIALVAGLWFGADTLADKLRGGDLGLSRIALQEVTLRMFHDHAALGVGAGAYAALIPAYLDGRLSGGIIDHAHNDYLELAAEQGIVGLAIGGLALAAILMPLLLGLRRRRDRLARAALFASLAGTVALLAHGLVDFNFRIPANAAWFCALAGIGIAAGRIERPAIT